MTDCSLREELHKWSKRTRLPAVLNIVDSKSSVLIKLLWIFSLIMFTFILGHKIFILVIDYFK